MTVVVSQCSHHLPVCTLDQIACFWFCNWAVLRVWTGETNLHGFGIFRSLWYSAPVLWCCVFPSSPLLFLFVCQHLLFMSSCSSLPPSSDCSMLHHLLLFPDELTSLILFSIFFFFNFCRIAVSVSILSNLIRELFRKGLCFSDNQLLAVASNRTQNKSCLLWPFVLTDVLLSAEAAHTKTRDSYTQQGSADNSRSTEKICTQICALASHAAACNRICSFTLWLTIISPVFISILPDLIPKKTL